MKNVSIIYLRQVVPAIVLSPPVMCDSVTPRTVAHQAPPSMGFAR